MDAQTDGAAADGWTDGRTDGAGGDGQAGARTDGALATSNGNAARHDKNY